MLSGKFVDNTVVVGRSLDETKLNQQWRLLPYGPQNLIRIQNVQTGTFAASSGPAIAGAVQVQCWTRPPHDWIPKSTPEPNALTLQVSTSNYVMEFYAGSSSEGNNAVIWPFNANIVPVQAWYVEYADPGPHTLPCTPPVKFVFQGSDTSL